jgi:site-specific DNA recombinase
VEGREKRERERIERQVDAMEREVQRLIDAYQVGAIDLAELQERRRRRADHQQVLRRRLGELQQQRWEREQELRLLQGLEGFCASIRSALTEPSFAVKRVAGRFVQKCTLRRNLLAVKALQRLQAYRAGL